MADSIKKIEQHPLHYDLVQGKDCLQIEFPQEYLRSEPDPLERSRWVLEDFERSLIKAQRVKEVEKQLFDLQAEFSTLQTEMNQPVWIPALNALNWKSESAWVFVLGTMIARVVFINPGQWKWDFHPTYAADIPKSQGMEKTFEAAKATVEQQWKIFQNS